MLSALALSPLYAALSSTLTAAPTVPLFLEVDPVLVGIIAVLLLIVFAFFLLVRKTLLNLSEGMREGRRR